jgi:hypothetical protein
MLFTTQKIARIKKNMERVIFFFLASARKFWERLIRILMKKEALADFYRKQLKTQILPFWLKHAADRECGGYLSCLDRYGNVYDADKVDILMQGRISWTFSWMYNEFERQQEWLDSSQGMNSYLQTMWDLGADAGQQSGQFQYAEGWRRREHWGFCGADDDPLRAALADLIVDDTPRDT